MAILKNAKKDTELEEKWRRTEEKRIQFIPYFLKTYPEKLKYITDPPYALYVLGQLPDEKRKSAAIVGARNCTAYGEQMALQYGKSLAEAGIQIISGMARGIDGAGQRGALNSSWAKESGVTYAVLGCGVDVCYPRENIGLYMDIQEKGGIVSEFSPGTQPYAWNFPRRNRSRNRLRLTIKHSAVMENHTVKSGNSVRTVYITHQKCPILRIGNRWKTQFILLNN